MERKLGTMKRERYNDNITAADIQDDQPQQADKNRVIDGPDEI
jgi:hypothetical protein